MDNSDGIRILEARLARLERKAADMSEDILALKESLENNTEALKEFLDISKNLKVGLKLLAVIESIAVWCTKVAAGVVLLWAAWKFLVKEAVAHVIK